MPPGPTIRPLETVTIARLYMKQGLLDEAEALYLRLQERRPDDPRVHAGLAEVRRRRAAELAGPDSDDWIVLRADEDGIRCTWRITEAGRQRAAAMERGAGEGRITLRVACFPRDEGSDEQEIQVGMSEGSLTLRPPAGALSMSAAAGLLLAEDRFVAIAHCAPVSLELEGK